MRILIHIRSWIRIRLKGFIRIWIRILSECGSILPVDFILFLLFLANQETADAIASQPRTAVGRAGGLLPTGGFAWGPPRTNQLHLWSPIRLLYGFAHLRHEQLGGRHLPALPVRRQRRG
jgi:hypothetical protein